MCAFYILSVSRAFQGSFGHPGNFSLFPGLYRHVHLLNTDTTVA